MVDSITGLVAAAFTPMHGDGSLNLDQVGPIVDHLESIGTRGIYVVGSTGEGMQLIDLDCGPVRLPLEPLDGPDLVALEQELDAAGFFDWTELRDAQSFLRSKGCDFSGHR